MWGTVIRTIIAFLISATISWFFLLYQTSVCTWGFACIAMVLAVPLYLAGGGIILTIPIYLLLKKIQHADSHVWRIITSIIIILTLLIIFFYPK